MAAETQTHSADWLKQQLVVPQALYDVSELATMSGLDSQRVRRYLEGKKLITPSRGAKGGKHEVSLDRLVQVAPEFWHAIRLRISKYVGGDA